MQIGDSVDVDGNMTASGKLGGGIQASQAGDAVLLGSDGLIPASLLPSTDSGWVQPYFFIDSAKIPNLSLSNATNINAYTTYDADGLVFLNQTLLIGTKSTSSGMTYTTRELAQINGVPVFSRYAIDSNVSKKVENCKTKTISGTALATMLSPYIHSNVTGSLNMYFEDFYNFAGYGTVILQDGEITGGEMVFRSTEERDYKFRFSSKWWIS